MREKPQGWWGRWWNATDPTQDVKLAGFGAVVIAAILMLWKEQGARGITDQWVSAFYGLCALVGLGGTAWAAVERWRGSDARGGKAPGPGAQEQEGEGR